MACSGAKRMNGKMMIRYIALLFCAFLMLWEKASGADKKVIDVCVSNDDSIVTDRIIRKALHNMGYEVNISCLEKMSAVAAVNDEQHDILAAGMEGLEKEYKNLVPVSIPIGMMGFNVYGKKEKEVEISGWQSLNGYRVGAEYQKPYILNQLETLKNVTVCRYKEKNELMEALEKDLVDVVIIPTQYKESVYCPPDVELKGEIEEKPVYVYVNKKYQNIVPMLGKELEKIKKSGELEEIQKKYLTEEDGKKVILHIMSYNGEMKEESDLNAGIRETLLQYPDAQLHTISLNSSLWENHNRRFQMFGEMLRSDFNSRPPDVFIVSGNYALDFLKEYYFQLFEGIPIIFINVEGAEFSGFGNNLLYLEKKIPLKETVEEILSLYPHTKEIFAVNDMLKDGMAWETIFKRELKDFENRVKITYSGKVTFEELLKTFRTLPEDTVVLTGTYYGDNSNRYYSGKEIQARFWENCFNPVFSCNIAGFGEGEIGGKYIDKSEIGRYAGDLAIEIANGKELEKIKVNKSRIESRWYFDAVQLKKWNIKEKKLPRGAVIINKGNSLKEKNPVAYYLVIALGVLGTVVMIILIRFICLMYRKNQKLLRAQKNLVETEEVIKKDKAIREGEERLEAIIESYRRNQRDLKQMIDSLPWPMCIINPTDISLYYKNHAFESYFGLDEKEENNSIWNVIPEYQLNGELSVEYFKRYVQRIINLKNSLEDEMEYVLENGERRLMKTIGAEIEYDGKDSIFVVLQDISAQKRLEEHLRNMAAREKEANQLKNKFIINMSHEIRTPMNAVIGLSDIELLKKHSPEVQQAFVKINASAKLLLAIVNDILDFSKMEANRIELEEEEFVLEDVIASALDTSSPRLLDKSVEMLLRIDKSIPKKLFGDKVRLWQIIKNILDNSAKFTDRGKIILDVCVEEIIPKQTTISFVVEDTGKGMSTQELEKIFIPFEQFGETGSKVEGTGLGMPIIRQLVELMNGSIQIESQLNVGTKTKIVIPFRSEKEEQSIGKEWDNGLLKGKKVLIVDDDQVACEIMKELLQAAGANTYIITEAEKVVPEVLRHYEEGNGFEIILLDHILDKGTGVDVVKKLEEHVIGNPKILMVSAYAKLKHEDIMREQLFSDIIDKPFVASEFLNKISNALWEKGADKKKTVKHLNFPNAKVLICEDNIINQDVIRGILNLYGINPVIVNNGKEGIALLEEQRFDMVIMDMLMPVMDGHAATLEIRNSMKEYKDVPIIAMTANAMKEERERCRREGMNGYISKPIDLDILYKELLKWLPAEGGKEKQAENQNASDEEGADITALQDAGIDALQGIKRFGGNSQLYGKTLKNFAKDILEKEFPPFPEQMEEEEKEEFKRYIHTIKGITANLSLNIISEKIKNFEQMLKEGASKEEDYRKIKEELTDSAKKIQAIFEESSDGEKIQGLKEYGTREMYQKLIQDLSEFLLKGKAKECEEVTEQLKGKRWEGAVEETMEEICNAVDSYDYGKALELVGKEIFSLQN